MSVTPSNLGISAYDKSPKTKEEIGSYAYKQRKYWDTYHIRKHGERDLLGLSARPTKAQAYQYMSMRMPAMRMYRLPRAVAERIDLSSDAKLVYSFLACFNVHPRLYVVEIAGMCGLSMDKTSGALHDLEQYRLIKIKRNYYTKNRQAPSTYIRLPYVERFREDPVPGIFKNKLDNLEKRINDRFKL